MSSSPPPGILQEVERALRPSVEGGGTGVRTAPVGGGCVNQAVRLQTDSGDSFFLKWNPEAPPDLFKAEVEGLRALGRTGSVRVPTVLGVGSHWILLEFVEEGPVPSSFGRTLGRTLARLHDTGGEAYGWDRDNFIGPLPQVNGRRRRWMEFWRERRILPQLRRAVDGGALGSADAQAAEKVADSVDLLLDDSALRPSLLHGDLWSGNVMADPDGAPVLVDPAVYLGHREVDLAMAELFGGFPRDFLPSYREAAPLPPGYDEVRRDVYQLYPLLVHVNLFGGGYVGSLMARVRKLLRV